MNSIWRRNPSVLSGLKLCLEVPADEELEDHCAVVKLASVRTLFCCTIADARATRCHRKAPREQNSVLDSKSST